MATVACAGATPTLRCACSVGTAGRNRSIASMLVPVSKASGSSVRTEAREPSVGLIATAAAGTTRR